MYLPLQAPDWTNPMDFRDWQSCLSTMGVQPPTDELEEEPDVVEFGIAALDARLTELDVSFPTDAETLTAEYGNLTVPVNAAGHKISLGEAIEETGRTNFDSERDLLNALHPVFETRREKTSRSVLAQLRSLVPF